MFLLKLYKSLLQIWLLWAGMELMCWEKDRNMMRARRRDGSLGTACLWERDGASCLFTTLSHSDTWCPRAISKPACMRTVKRTVSSCCFICVCLHVGGFVRKRHMDMHVPGAPFRQGIHGNAAFISREEGRGDLYLNVTTEQSSGCDETRYNFVLINPQFGGNVQ